MAFFAFVFCLTQKEHSLVSKSFGAFLAAVALESIPATFGRIIELLPKDPPKLVEFIIWMPSALFLAPLLWLYVYALTSTEQKLPARWYGHLLLPVLAALVGLLTLLMSPEGWATLVEGDDLPTSPQALAMVLVAAILQLAAYPQIAIYLFLIIRRLMRYRLKLRDYYASTEEHELRWIYVIGGLGILFWLALALVIAIEIGAEEPGTSLVWGTVSVLAGFGLIAATTLWGLRQSPPLAPSIDGGLPSENNSEQQPEQRGEKYEKSALSSEASARITRKLRAAMETDHLYRDPNISLWALARHIGASPNYISQTLNEVIGKSFFDFINAYRIDEAKILLATTDDTVLAITYDVGFNARSSFYNAFKRVTGQTPTTYRKNNVSP